jgi:DNA-binding LytR/AlgR family response regulator
MRIAICDDEYAQRQFLQELVSSWAQGGTQSERGESGTAPLPTTIRTFDSAEAFLFAFAEDQSFDILLLDIQLQAMDGVALAKEIRKENEVLQIIFITGYSDYIAEGYDVSALHYLMKPVDEQKLFEVLDRATARVKAFTVSPGRTILFPKGGGMVRISAADIHYAEAFSHYVTLYTKDKQQDFSMRLSDMEQLLGEGLRGLRWCLTAARKYRFHASSMMLPIRRLFAAVKVFADRGRGVSLCRFGRG